MSVSSRITAWAALVSLLAGCGGGAQPAAVPGSGTSAFMTRDIVLSTGSRAHVMLPFRAGISEMGTHLGASSGGLLYHAGPVQVATKIYVVFWGKSWSSTGDPQHAAPTLLAFYRSIGGGSWINSQTQYAEKGGGRVGNPAPMLSGSYVDTSSSPVRLPSDASIGAEAARAAAHFKDYSDDASYVVALPSGVVPSGFVTQFCAWHSSERAGGGTIAYTNLPYLPDAGAACGASSVNKPGTLDGVTIVAGHEQAETMTDPQPSSGWAAADGEEDGDLCAWTGLANNPGAGNFPTQPLWSNLESGCVQNG